MSEFIRAFILIVFAEMGDKTQILAMTFATQYKIRDVLLGVILGIGLNHGLAILLGSLFSSIIPINLIQNITGLIFILFAFFTMLEDEEDEEDRSFSKYGPILTVAITFFLGELADKSQLTAMALALESSKPLIILLGTVSAMTFTSGLGILAGMYIGDKISDKFISIISSIVFLFFGISKFIEIYGLSNIVLPTIIVIGVEVILIRKYLKEREKIELSPLQIAAKDLYNQTKGIQEEIDTICLGEDNCKRCLKDQCLVGYINWILAEARRSENYELKNYKTMEELIKRELDRKKVADLLIKIIEESKKYNWPKDDEFVINKIARYLEEYLFKESISEELGSIDYINRVKEIDEPIGKYLEKILI